MPLRRLAVGIALALGAVVAAANPAAAHALLLRADPSPQSTAPASPAALRLFYSESVEVAPGDVRVYDVDGHRVDSNRVSRKDGGREVDVALPHLDDGTYTVTWRVVSSDTHPVRGGFIFYVGHPSSISAVAIDQPHGASHSVGFAFGLDRFLWYAALMAIVGTVVLRRWAWTPTVRAAGLSSDDAAERFRTSFSRALVASWIVLALSGLAALALQSATTSGRPFWSSLAGSDLRSVLDRAYGHTWLLEMALTAALVGPIIGLARRHGLLGAPPDAWIATGGVLVAGLCAAAAWQGHARTDARPALTLTSVAVHLLAVGVWAGGLAALVALARPAWRGLDPEPRRVVVRGVVVRFSTIAVVAVAVVAVTGTISAIANFHAVSDLWHYTYGRVVAAKAAILLVALLIAARHRFVTPRRLSTDAAGGEVRTFSSWASAELVALVGAVALAAALVAMVPGRTLALAAGGPVNTEHKAGDFTVQLLVDPTRTGRNDIHVTFVDPTGLAAGQIISADATLTPPSGAPSPLALRLIGPGHFTTEADLPARGRYRIAVTAPQASTTFTFSISKGA